jgi:SAM-dependent methyltransferase
VCGKPVDGFSKGLQLELKRKARVFEHGVSAGCGNGTKEFELMKEGIVKRFTLFELSTERVKQARQKAESLGLLDRVEIIQEDCFLHKFKEKVDLVHWNNSLHHMLDTKKAVKWSYEILSPGGVFYMDDFVGPNRFQWSDEALKLGTKIRRVLPKGFLRNPYRKGRYLPRKLTRPNARRLKDSDPSEAADSSNIIQSIKEYFPNAKIKLTGGLIYHATLNDILYNISESDEKDKAILELLLIIDELSLNSGVESQYATALGVKEKIKMRNQQIAYPNRWRLQNAWVGVKPSRKLVTGLFGRTAKALLPYYQRLVPSHIKTMIPLRLRHTIERWLLKELEGARPKVTVQQEESRPLGGVNEGQYQEQAMSCNLCGSTHFAAMKNRPNARCAQCGSLERTRLLYLYLGKLGLPKPGSKVLHFSPQKGLYYAISKIVDAGDYTVADIEPEGFPFAKNIVKFDLCKDVETLPDNYFDLIIHSHVLEHVKCNVSYILFHLHRALKQDGWHICVIPFSDGSYEECLANIEAAEATRRFGQSDHVRRFGRDNIDNTLGKILRFDKDFDATRDFHPEILRKYNIPETSWHGLTPDTVLCLQKYDMRLIKHGQ